MAERDGRVMLVRWVEREEPVGSQPESLPVKGGYTYDPLLVAWLLALAEQGTVTPGDRAQLRVEGTDGDVLAVGQLIRYCRDVLEWPMAQCPALLASWTVGLSLGTSLQVLATIWARIEERDGARARRSL